MMKWGILFVTAIGTLSWSAPKSPAQAPGRCLLRVKNVDHQYSQNDLMNNGVNITYDAGGHVRLQCDKQNVFLNADSVSAMSGDYVRFFGHVLYRDSLYRIKSDTLIYLLRLEKIEARGNVHMLDSLGKSTLDGPWVDYWREVKGVNDSARIEALLRPTVHYFGRRARNEITSNAPYVVVAENLKGFGQTRLIGNGKVTIDRDSLHGEGDSTWSDQGAKAATLLFGKLASVVQRGADSFAVRGREIRLRSDNDTIRDLRAVISAQVVRGTTDIRGDTVYMSFAAGKLSLTHAWGKVSGGTLASSGYNIAGDSLAVDTPAEQLREIRVFRRAIIQNPYDSVAAAVSKAPGDTIVTDSTRNTIWGEKIIAKFNQVDSAGKPITRISDLRAYGKAADQARSLFARLDVDKNGKRSPSINYTLADTILIRMKQADSTGVESVFAVGHVTGLQLDAESLERTRIKNDSSKKSTLPSRPRP